MTGTPHATAAAYVLGQFCSSFAYVLGQFSPKFAYGLGNVFLDPPKAKKIEKSASEFLVEQVSEYPGEVSVLALGPLTNLALVSLHYAFLQFMVLNLTLEIYSEYLWFLIVQAM